MSNPFSGVMAGLVPAIHVLPVQHLHGSNQIDIIISLVLRSALLRASRRTAAGEAVPAAILRDGRAKSAASSG